MYSTMHSYQNLKFESEPPNIDTLPKKFELFLSIDYLSTNWTTFMADDIRQELIPGTFKWKRHRFAHCNICSH